MSRRSRPSGDQIELIRTTEMRAFYACATWSICKIFYSSHSGNLKPASRHKIIKSPRWFWNTRLFQGCKIKTRMCCTWIYARIQIFVQPVDTNRLNYYFIGKYKHKIKHLFLTWNRYRRRFAIMHRFICNRVNKIKNACLFLVLLVEITFYATEVSAFSK